MAMVSLVNPKKVKEPNTSQGAAPPSPAGEATQPPPTIHLGHEHLKKLGLKHLPPVGTKLHFHAVGHVGSVSEDQDRGDGQGGARRSMSLHIHQMDLDDGAQQGMPDGDTEEQSKKGARAAMDKALEHGSEKSKAKPAGGKQGGKGG